MEENLNKMITSYNQYIKENIKKATYQDIGRNGQYNRYSNYVIGNFCIIDCHYTINDDGSINLDKSIDLKHKKFDRLPFDFKEINGDFNCSDNNLTTLKGCPEKVNGGFYCENNLLTSLEFGPKYVSGRYWCKNNNFSNNIENYPLCIIDGEIWHYPKESFSSPVGENKSNNSLWRYISIIIRENKELFSTKLDDKIKFHRQLISLQPDLLKYYTKWNPFTKKQSLLL